MRYTRTVLKSRLKATVCSLLLVTSSLVLSTEFATAQTALSSEQISTMQQKAEADLAALLAQIQSAKTSEAEAQALIQRQAGELAALQQELRNQPPVVSSTAVAPDNTTSQLIADIEKQSEDKIQALVSEHAAQIAELQSELSTATHDLTQQQILVFETEHTAKIQTLVQQHAEQLARLQTDLTDAKKIVTELGNDKIAKSAALESELEKSKKLQQQLTSLKQQTESEAAKHADVLEKSQNDIASLNLKLQQEEAGRLDTAKQLNKALRDIADLSKASETKALQTSQQHAQTLSMLRSSLQDYRDQLEASKQATAKIKQDLVSSAAAHQNLLDENTKLADQATTLQTKLEHANRRIDSLDSRLKRSLIIRKRLVMQLNEAREEAKEAAKLHLPALQAMNTDVLFASGSARLSKEGEKQIADLIPSLQQKLALLPAEKDWVLVIEGHADATPIRRSRYKSNLALSMARALSVVRQLSLKSEIEPKRLMAAGFGEHRPVRGGSTKDDLTANRRVELRLLER